MDVFYDQCENHEDEGLKARRFSCGREGTC